MNDTVEFEDITAMRWRLRSTSCHDAYADKYKFDKAASGLRHYTDVALLPIGKKGLPGGSSDFRKIN